MKRLGFIQFPIILIIMFISFISSSKSITIEAGAEYIPRTHKLDLIWVIYNKKDNISKFEFTILKGQGASYFSEKLKIQIEANDEKIIKSQSNYDAYYYQAKDIALEDGNFAIFMKAIYQDGSSIKSDTNYFLSYNDYYEYIWFIQEPNNRATLNVKYESFIKASGNLDTNRLEYKLVDGPEGMTVDKKTGKIEFIPQKIDLISYKIRAYDNKHVNSSADYSSSIVVNSCENLGKIEGKVIYNDNFFQRKGYVSVGKVVKGEIQYFNNFYRKVSEDGAFSLSVDEGEYAVYFTPLPSEDLYRGEFYKDQSNVRNANLVKVECGKTNNIEWEVGSDFKYSKYKVSGYVKTYNGEPLVDEKVTFKQMNIIGDPLYDYYFDYSSFAYTDEKGYYEVILPDTLKYLAYVTKQISEDVFRILYWEGAYNENDAKILYVDSDLENINFIYKKSDLDIDNGSISGKITNSNNQPMINTNVYTVLVNSFDDYGWEYLYERVETKTDKNGDYSFEKLPYGEYVVYSIPNDTNYVPVFYSNTGNYSFTWDQATKIVYDGDNNSKNINITLVKLQEKQGIGTILGRVKSKGGGQFNDNPGKAISDANIFLIGSDSSAIKFGKSSISGNYNLKNLPNGKYEIIVDKFGYLSHKEWIEINDSTLQLKQDIELTPIKVSSIYDNFDNEELIIYPNPASNLLNLIIHSECDLFDIEIYNLLGIKQLSLLNQKFNRANLLTTNLGNLPNGNYFIKVSGCNKVYSSTFIIYR